MSAGPYIWTAPDRCGGLPCVGGTRLSVQAIAREVWASPDGVGFLCRFYPISREQALVACWYQARNGLPSWRKRWSAWADEHEGAMRAGHWVDVPNPPSVGDGVA